MHILVVKFGELKKHVHSKFKPHVSPTDNIEVSRVLCDIQIQGRKSLEGKLSRAAQVLSRVKWSGGWGCHHWLVPSSLLTNSLMAGVTKAVARHREDETGSPRWNRRLKSLN